MFSKRSISKDQHGDHAGLSPDNVGMNKQSLLWGLVAFFIVFALQSLFIKQFGVNVPVWDEWVNYRLIASFNQGTLTFAQLFAQHNEHRIFFPRILWIALYLVFGEINLLSQMLLSALMIGLAAAFWTMTLVRLRVSPWAALLTCVILTTPEQWQNSITGFQVVFWLMIASAVFALSLTAFASRISWMVLVSVIVACVVSTFSVASGMAIWGACGIGLALRLWLDAPSVPRLLRDRTFWLKLGVFAFFAVTCVILYFKDYQSLATHDNLRADTFSVYLDWFIRAITYPIFEHGYSFGRIFGLFQWLVILSGIFLYVSQRDNAANRRKIVLIFGFLVFIFLTAAIMAYGRGGAYLISSRYVTFFIWNFGIFAMTAADLITFLSSRREVLAYIGLFAISLTIVGVVSIHSIAYKQARTNIPTVRTERIAQATTLINYFVDPTTPIHGSMPTIPPLLDEVLNDPAKRSLLPAWILDRSMVLPISTFGDAWSFRGVRAATDDRASWGSWSDDPLATGRIESVPFLITQPYLIVNLTGYPNRSGNRLILETLDGSGDWLRYNDANPGLTWHEWHVDASAFMGRYVRIVAIDNSTDAQGWLGFGSVRFVSPTIRTMDALIGNLEWLVGGTFILIMTTTFVVSQTPPDLRSRPVVAVTLLAIVGLTIYCAQTPPASRTLFSLHPQRLTQEPFALLRALPPSFVDTSAMKRVPDGLFMHPNAGLVLGPFEAQAALCFTAQAQIDPSAPLAPEHDGVQFVAQVQIGDHVLAQTQTTAAVAHPAQMRLELPVNQPFTISLQTQMRNNSAYDWAIWHQPQIAPCSP